MSQPQKRKYVRRKKVQAQQAVPDEIPIVDSIINTSKNKYQESISDITSLQDEEYEMSIMMDIIKMQEREENERIEKEKEKIEKERESQLKDAQELEEQIRTQNHNIKEILRKIKIGNSLLQIEYTIIGLLENIMETQDMHIHINDIILYNDICSYLGIGDENKRGTIRLPDTVKLFAKKLFTHVQI